MKRFPQKATLPALAFAAFIGLAGCVKKTFDTEVKRMLTEEYSMTEEQAMVGVGGALRYRFMTERDGKLEFNYHSLKLEDVLSKQRDMKQSLQDILNPNDAETRRFVDLFNQRAHFEREEQKVDYRIDRFSLVLTYDKFVRLMKSQRRGNDSVGITNPYPQGLTDLDIMFAGTNLARLLQFTAKYVDDAKAGNRLNQIENLVMSVQYEEEEPNPDYPQVDPNNATRWVQRSRALRIMSFDCDTQPDHRADYIEVYRIGDDGTPEANPAIKVFKSQGSSTLDVAVLDRNPANQRGHGTPDDVESLSFIERGSELYDSRRDLLESLFKTPEVERRQLPKEAPIEAEIVRVGELGQQEFQISTDGWSCPLEYRVGNNYSLWVKFKDEESHDHANPRPREIEYVAKRYFVPGSSSDVQARVVEFYRVKPEFAQRVRLVTVNNETKMLEIVREGEAAQKGMDSLFLERDRNDLVTPFRIDYDSGNLRISLLDRDRNPEPLYEAKAEMSRPHTLNLRNDARTE